LSELAEVQGHSVDIGGYYYPDREKTTAVMRPSETFNSVLEAAHG
jgi:isocitrate dehydrogenase